jgi:predicted alpha/beta-hydrolase family hydrolase
MARQPGIARFETDGVRGFLHTPNDSANLGMVLTHGAGSDCSSPLLVKVAEAFCSAGVTVLRCDLPFRQQRPSGPPQPGKSAADRAGLKLAIATVSDLVGGSVFLAGHSYGGRQASLLAAEEPGLALGLLLLSYPLHPPKKPEQLRVQHFPQLRTPSVFVHGTADPFGSIAELKSAIAAIPAATQLITVEAARHDLGGARFDPTESVAAVLSGLTGRPKKINSSR